MSVMEENRAGKRNAGEETASLKGIVRTGSLQGDV